MKRLLEGYHRLLTWLLAASVAILVVPVTLQVVSRYTALIPAWIWTEELSRFLFIWMVMLGSMVAVREGTHFIVDVLPQMRPRPTAALQIVTNLCILAFAGVFVGWGVEFVRFGWDQTSELAELPMTFIFIAWPVAGITWIAFLAESFAHNLRVLAGRDVR